MLRNYHKINGLYMRDHNTNKFIKGQYSQPEFELLSNITWEWTEKLDGTNVKIGIDEEGEYSVGGRTNKSILPPLLVSAIEELDLEPKLREEFTGPITLYGEGIGYKIQACGPKYLPESNEFVLFDIRIGDIWMKREDVTEIAARLGIRSVPVIGAGTITEATDLVRAGFQSRITLTELQAEGLVVVPKGNLLTRRGRRIITKIKTRDFQEEE